MSRSYQRTVTGPDLAQACTVWTGMVAVVGVNGLRVRLPPAPPGPA